MQKINFISSIRADDRAAIEKAEREQNAPYCLGISFMLCIFSLTGLIGTFAPQTSGSIFPRVNATMVYAVLLGVSLVFFLLFSGEVLKLRNRIRLADWIFPLFYVLNMIMASFTFLTTEKGSSYFFEFILLTLLVYLFPLHTHRELVWLFLSSMAAFILVSLLVNRFYAWQDLFDLAMLHFFCIAISIVRWNMFVRDISLQISLKNAQNELYGKSRIDVLTGLQNRTALRDDFASFLNANLCTALLDVDSFKQLNDTYGHYYGDKILSFLGKAMRAVFDHPGDSCYRYGGDEMLIISHDQVPEAFYGRLKQLQVLCADEEKNGFRVGLSIGCCSGTPGTAEELRRCIGLADRCLYDVKSTEKGKIKGCLLNQSKGKAEEEKQRKQDFLMTLVSFDEMKAQFELAVRDHPDWSVVYFDICHFSEIDEKFGFRTGRWVLEKVAALGKIKDTEC
ncbi:MAG: diguanylate cyclase [Lachnospiraceae bacterium]|nr:diguanylate cyclase [Lachnospiraceae bacterium]